MPRPCTVCQSADREAIDAALRDGASLREIAARFAVGRMAVQRHREHTAPGQSAPGDTVPPNPWHRPTNPPVPGALYRWPDGTLHEMPSPEQIAARGA